MEFYRLQVIGRNIVDYAEGNDWEGITCSIDKGHRRAGRRITELILQVTSPEILDFSLTFLSDIVITDRALQILRDEQLKGFEVKPARITTHPAGLDMKELPTLWEFLVTGWGGMASEKSGITLEKSCPACRHMEYAGLSNPKTLLSQREWDGSDFFFIWPMPRYCFVAEHAIEIIERRQLTGVRFTPIGDLPPTDGFSPGTLSHWLPDDRARVLGQPLGIY